MIPILLLSVLLLLSSAASEAGSTTAVLDVGGRKLRRGAQYYILPAHPRGGGGGLTLARRNATCPLNVAQEKAEMGRGYPVTFLPFKPEEDTVRLSTDANVVFSAATACAQSTAWRLGDFDWGKRRYYVTAGGGTGNPGLTTVGSWFKIERYGRDYYSIRHCPSVCRFCKVICKDVGVFSEKGRRWLGLGDVPFPVVFQRVKKTAPP